MFRRRSLTAALVNKLVDKETCIRSDVSGRGKDQLDSKIIQYVKNFFEMLPSDKDSAKKKDWDDCVAAIDDKERDMKLKMNKLQDKHLLIMYVYIFT